MDSLSTQLPLCSSTVPAAAAACCPQWMLLAPYVGGIDEACNITGDTKTIAAAATSKGHRITVSLRREPSPALSRICLRFLPGTDKYNSHSAYSKVIAAHGGSVLVQIASNDGRKPCGSNYFLYNYNNAVAGAADPARPPSLYLLPCYTKQWRELDISATGLVCHGEAEFVVAELKIVGSKDVDAAAAKAVASPIAFELLLYRHGEWCVKRPRIVGDYHGKDGDLLLGTWEFQAVVPLSERLLCWVVRYKYLGVYRHAGIIFSDMLDECPELCFVPFPAVVTYGCFLCTDARGALKMVRLSPRCCSHCGCSEHATAVDTWTLKTDDMAWVLELETETNYMVDGGGATATELWASETRVQVGYARVHLVYPVASMNGRGRHHVVQEESSAPTEEEVEHKAGN